MHVAKPVYFTVFSFVVIAFVFHITAMGFNQWKRADPKNSNSNLTTIGLFTRCYYYNDTKGESCTPNLFPNDANCSAADCESSNSSRNCRCDYTPSTKGIAACAIIASIFLGIALIILFVHSIGTTNSRGIELLLAFLPLISLLLAFIFILIALILVGSYLSRDIMHIVRNGTDTPVQQFRQQANDWYNIRIGWTSGLEIIALVFSFFSFIIYILYVFKFGRAS